MANENSSPIPWENVIKNERQDGRVPLLQLAQKLTATYTSGDPTALSQIEYALSEFKRIPFTLPPESYGKLAEIHEAETHLVSYLLAESESPNTDVFHSVRSMNGRPTHVVFYVREATRQRANYKTLEVPLSHITDADIQKTIEDKLPESNLLPDLPLPPLAVIAANNQVNSRKRRNLLKAIRKRREEGEEIPESMETQLKVLSDEKYDFMVSMLRYVRGRKGGKGFGAARVYVGKSENIDNYSRNRVSMQIRFEGRRNDPNEKIMRRKGNILDLARALSRASQLEYSPQMVLDLLKRDSEDHIHELARLRREQGDLQQEIRRKEGFLSVNAARPRRERRDTQVIQNEIAALNEQINNREIRITQLEAPKVKHKSTQTGEQPAPQPQADKATIPSAQSEQPEEVTDEFQDTDDIGNHEDYGYDENDGDYPDTDESPEDDYDEDEGYNFDGPIRGTKRHSPGSSRRGSWDE